MVKRVRLIDIAERLQITKVSVSKALRDHPDISKETRDLVKKTAAEMGYSPNLLARSLSSRRSLTLGVVVPKIAHTFFSSIIEAVQVEATREGYGIVLAVSNENAALERQHIERLLAMRVDGLLVSVSKQKPDLDVYRQIRDMSMPLVFFDRHIKDSPFSSVTVNDREGAYMAVDTLIRMGYRRIAHIAGSADVEIGRERRAGYEAALRAHRIEPNPAWILEGGFDEWHGYHAAQKILEGGDLPDVIFAATYPVGLGVMRALREKAPHLLEKIRLMTFGEGFLNEFNLFPQICIRQPTRDMGREALRLLLEEIENGPPETPHRIVLETDLILPDRFNLPAGPGGEENVPA